MSHKVQKPNSNASKPISSSKSPIKSPNVNFNTKANQSSSQINPAAKGKNSIKPLQKNNEGKTRNKSNNLDHIQFRSSTSPHIGNITLNNSNTSSIDFLKLVVPQNTTTPNKNFTTGQSSLPEMHQAQNAYKNQAVTSNFKADALEKTVTFEFQEIKEDIEQKYKECLNEPSLKNNEFNQLKYQSQDKIESIERQIKTLEDENKEKIKTLEDENKEKIKTLENQINNLKSEHEQKVNILENKIRKLTIEKNQNTTITSGINFHVNHRDRYPKTRSNSTSRDLTPINFNLKEKNKMSVGDSPRSSQNSLKLINKCSEATSIESPDHKLSELLKEIKKYLFETNNQASFMTSLNLSEGLIDGRYSEIMEYLKLANREKCNKRQISLPIPKHSGDSENERKKEGKNRKLEDFDEVLEKSDDLKGKGLQKMKENRKDLEFKEIGFKNQVLLMTQELDWLKNNYDDMQDKIKDNERYICELEEENQGLFEEINKLKAYLFHLENENKQTFQILSSFKNK